MDASVAARRQEISRFNRVFGMDRWRRGAASRFGRILLEERKAYSKKAASRRSTGLICWCIEHACIVFDGRLCVRPKSACSSRLCVRLLAVRSPLAVKDYYSCARSFSLLPLLALP
jgi:hypothetical protein